MDINSAVITKIGELSVKELPILIQAIEPFLPKNMRFQVRERIAEYQLQIGEMVRQGRCTSFEDRRELDNLEMAIEWLSGKKKLEDITLKALQKVKSEQKILNITQPSPEFISTFIGITNEIPDNEEIINFWSLVLANDLSNNNKISPRTLNTLRHLTKSEAETFKTITQGVFWGGVYKPIHEARGGLPSLGLTYTHIENLRHADLLSPSDTLIKPISDFPDFEEIESELSIEEISSLQPPKGSRILVIGDRVYIVQPPFLRKNIPVYNLTTAGKELFPIVFSGYSDIHSDVIESDYTQGGLLLNRLPLIYNPIDETITHY